MGADLILAHIWTTKPDSELDWDAARSAIEALTVDDVDSESHYSWNDAEVPTDDEEFLSKKVRPGVRNDLEEFKSLWQASLSNLPRDADMCTMGPVRALITGGMSWGDSPTETWDLLSRLPDSVLKAIGFFQ